jgi:hypothetical protein
MKQQHLARFDPFYSGVPEDSYADSMRVTEEEDEKVYQTDMLGPQEDTILPTQPPPSSDEISSDSDSSLLGDTEFSENRQLHKEPYVLKIPRSAPPQSRFISLQKWEGFVLRVQNDSFIARLLDENPDGPEEEAEIPLDEVSRGDLPLVKPGAVFYWNIGYSDSIDGPRERVSRIHFRRLPAWRAEELETAKQKAKYTRELLGW